MKSLAKHPMVISNDPSLSEGLPRGGMRGKRVGAVAEAGKEEKQKDGGFVGGVKMFSWDR